MDCKINMSHMYVWRVCIYSVYIYIYIYIYI